MIKRTNSKQFDSAGNQVNDNIQANNQNVVSSEIRRSTILSNRNSLGRPTHTIAKNNINSSSDDSIYQREQRMDKVHSMVVQPNDIKISQQINPTAQTQHMTNSAKRRQIFNKMPDSIKQSIVNLASGRKPAGSMTTSKVSKALFQKYRQFKNNTFICEICSCEYQMASKTRLSECLHVFCDSCLRHYVDYKISRFQEVLCPAQGCEQIMDTKSQFYNSLNQKLKQKYKKVHAFSMVSKNPNSRLCPNEKCVDGIIDIQDGVSPKCSKCSKVYCGKCLFPEHSGPCEKNELDFFQNNLHFRQCDQCKNVVQKTVGCNHIKCRCGYEFCYLCGAKWLNYQHKCATQNQPAPPQQLQQAQQPVIIQNAPQPDNCCYCLQGGGCCNGLIKILIKILIFPLFLAIILILILKTVVFLALLLGMTIVVGALLYTFEFICDFDCPFNVILLILYPFSMIIGIGRAFGDFFCQAASRMCQSLCEELPGVTECMLLW